MRYQRPVDPKWPVSARYGAKGPWWFRYIDPKSGLWEKGQLNKLGQHAGIDYAVPVGTPVYACVDGRIEKADWEAKDHTVGFGLRIRQFFMPAQDPLQPVVVSWRFYYGHLSETKVGEGDEVKAGQLLALSGNTGRTNGAHLHIEIRNQHGQPQPIPLEGAHA